MIKLWQREPALVIAAVNALIAVAVGFGADVSAAQTALIIAAVTAVLGLVTRSQVSPATALPALAPADAGEVGLSILFRIFALACFIIVALIGFEVLTSTDALGWLGLGLASWLLASFVA